MQSSLLRVCLLVASLLAMSACGADFASDMGSGAEAPDDAGQSEADASSGPGQGATDASSDAFEPEEPELVFRTNPPSASLRYVFVVNPTQGTVAKIDSETLAVTPIAVGRQPSVVRTIADGDVAVVLNTGSSSVSIIDASPIEDRVVSADVVEGCNQLDLSPKGDFAVAWYSNAMAQAGDPIGSLQEVTFVDLESATAFAVSVGFNVRSVVFSQDGTRAFVVTDSGVSIVPLEGLAESVAIASVPFGDDPLVSDVDREVQITGSGAYAILRSSAHAGVRMVDLQSGAAISVELPAIPTDVDIVEGEGAAAQAIVAMRDISELAIIDFAAALAEEENAVRSVSVDGPAGLATISADGASLLLYSTLNAERRVGAYALAPLLSDGVLSGSARFVAKAVRAVITGPSSDTALVIHAAPAESGTAGQAIDDLVDNAHAVSLLHVPSGYAKLVLLETSPDATVFMPNGEAAAIMLEDARLDVREVVLLNLTTYATRVVEMDAPPEAIGVVPGTARLFVSQRAESGRITFIDTADGSVRHVSAFQLNAYID